VSVKNTNTMASTNRNDEANGAESSTPLPRPSYVSGRIEGNDRPQAESQNVVGHTGTGKTNSSSMSNAGDRGPGPAVNGTTTALSLGQAQFDVTDLPTVNLDKVRRLGGVLDRNGVRADHAPAGSARSPTAHVNEGNGGKNTSNDQNDWSTYTRPSSFTIFL
jgi:hypothetical protein